MKASGRAGLLEWLGGTSSQESKLQRRGVLSRSISLGEEDGGLGRRHTTLNIFAMFKVGEVTSGDADLGREDEARKGMILALHDKQGKNVGPSSFENISGTASLL